MIGTEEIKEAVERELREDRAHDDVTTRAVVPNPYERAGFEVFSRQAGVFSGTDLCNALQNAYEKNLHLHRKKRDGDLIESGERVLLLAGPIGQCLALERTLLNFLSLSCGVATLTHQYVSAVKGLRTKILATRKTIPGLRQLQLSAVIAGGGVVHRRSLSDGILIKDNHLHFVEPQEAVTRAKNRCSPLHRVEIEVETLESLDEALKAAPDIIMLDNMDLSRIAQAIQRINGRCLVEVSGGVTLENVRSIAELGVDYISVGRLTHSVAAFDFSMEMKDSN